MTRAMRSPATLKPNRAAPSTVPGSSPRGVSASIVLDNVSWEFYEQTLDEFERQHIHTKVVYDNGRMELMTITNVHEYEKKLVARLIESYALARRIRLVGVGSVTLRKKDEKKGLEPDECYYVTSAAPKMKVPLLDLKKYAPPDLALEVDITHGSLARQPIYAVIGVPEIWRLDQDQITPLHRQASGKYRPATKSLAFPKLSIPELNRFLAMGADKPQDEVIFAFWDWLQETR